MSTNRTVAAAGLFASLLAAGVWMRQAHAQTVDYDAYERLFGEQVTASATGKPQRVSEAPVDMDVITAEQIARSGARTIPDALQYVAGIDVRQYGMQDEAVGIRGNDTALSPRVLVLLDGQQVYQDDYGLTVWSTIPVAIGEIRQIEIIKGPNAAFYGFNAVSGVINIITRNPLTDPQNTASIQAGTQNQTYGDAVTTAGRPGIWAVRLAAQGFRSNEFDNDDASSQQQQPRSGVLSVDGRYRIAPTLEWGLSGSISSLDSAYYADIGNYTRDVFRTNAVRTNLAWDSPLGDLRFDLYRNEERADAQTLVPISYRDDLVVADLSDLIKIGPHAFRIAGEYRGDDAASFNSFLGHIGYHDGAASGMWEWTLTPRVQWTNAVRVDAFLLDHHGSALDIPGLGATVHDARIIEPSFNTGLVIGLDGQDTIRLSAARAAQLPSLLDFGLQHTVGPIILAGNASLAPSEVTNYELDWERALPRLLSRLRSSIFFQHTDRTFGAPFGSGYTLLPTGQVLLMARNFPGSNEAGGEIELRGQAPSGLRWNLSYALASVNDHGLETALTGATSVNYQRGTPTNAVVAGIGYHRRNLDLDLQARWQSHFQDFRLDQTTIAMSPVTVANYVTMRLHASYQLTRSMLASVTIDQLNRHQLQRTAGGVVDRQIVGGLRVSL